MFELSEKAKDRLIHVDSHLNGQSFSPEFVRERLYLIAENKGKPDACMSQLQSYCQAKGVSNWYHGGALSVSKNWFYAKAKLFYIRANPPYHDGPLFPRAGRVFDAMEVLICDHPGLIDWYCSMDSGFSEFEEFRGNITTDPDFYTQQFFHAFRGEWEILGERAERVLAHPPKSGHAKSFLPDHRFYLALAKGDLVDMEQRIADLLTPRMLHSREGMESGYTNQLLSTLGTVYAKLAWRHGYQVDLDTPYIPQAWLPIEPLDNYEDPFDFMRQYGCG